MNQRTVFLCSRRAPPKSCAVLTKWELEDLSPEVLTANIQNLTKACAEDTVTALYVVARETGCLEAVANLAEQYPEKFTQDRDLVESCLKRLHTDLDTASLRILLAVTQRYPCNSCEREIQRTCCDWLEAITIRQEKSPESKEQVRLLYDLLRFNINQKTTLPGELLQLAVEARPYEDGRHVALDLVYRALAYCQDVYIYEHTELYIVRLARDGLRATLKDVKMKALQVLGMLVEFSADALLDQELIQILIRVSQSVDPQIRGSAEALMFEFVGAASPFVLDRFCDLMALLGGQRQLQSVIQRVSSLG